MMNPIKRSALAIAATCGVVAVAPVVEAAPQTSVDASTSTERRAACPDFDGHDAGCGVSSDRQRARHDHRAALVADGPDGSDDDRSGDDDYDDNRSDDNWARGASRTGDPE